jgi:anti-sigma factor RsiW
VAQAAREPSREELLAMAYADGELSGAERVEFERLLESREDLRRVVARERELAVLGRLAAGPEPMDAEWRALEQDHVHRAGLGVGLALVLGGLALGAASLLYLLWSAALPLALQLGATATVVGAAVLLLRALRARLRTRPLDPYTGIRR